MHLTVFAFIQVFVGRVVWSAFEAIGSCSVAVANKLGTGITISCWETHRMAESEDRGYIMVCSATIHLSLDGTDLKDFLKAVDILPTK